MSEGLHSEPGQLNPALLIQHGQVLGMELTAGNIFRIRIDDEWRDVQMAGMGVGLDGTPFLSLADATPEGMAARADEARRIGGPVPS